MLVLLALGIVLLAGCGPAPDALNPVNCFAVGSVGGGARLAVPSGPGEVVARHDDGTKRPINSSNTFVYVDSPASEWRVVALRDGEEVVGPRCSIPARVDPTPPEPALQWLPGATVAGEGVRGPARLSWPEVVHDGEPARFYEVRRLVHDRVTGALSDITVETLIYSGGDREIDTVLDVDERISLRAWWDDGVSAQVEADPPFMVDGPDVAHSLEITDVAWLSAAPGSVRPDGWARVSWNPVYDHRGVAAHGYQEISRQTHDGLRRDSFTIEQSFNSSVTSAILRSQRGFGYGLRAVWYDGGPLDGPQIAEVGGNQSPNPISQLRLNEITPTSAVVSFGTNTCTYGDYRIALEGQVGLGFRAVIDEFNAPRNGICYYDHGITLGVDTPPLMPGRSYIVTVVATNPETGHVHNEGPQLFTTASSS